MSELYHGDATKVLKQFHPNFFDALITDPPYSSGGATASETRIPARAKYTNTKDTCPYPDFAGEAMDQRTWTLFMTDVLTACREVCKPGAVCALFVDWRQLSCLSDAIQRAGWIWRGVAVWDKGNCRPQRGRFRQQAEFILWGSNGKLPLDRQVPCLPGIFRYSNVPEARRVHMTQKPLALMRDIVKLCAPGGRILDCFAGSGSTLEAANLEGYDATGIEVVSEIAHVAAGRTGVQLIREKA